MFLQSIFYIASLYSPIKIFTLIGVIFIIIGVLLSIAPLKLYFYTKTVPDYYIYRFLFIFLMFVGGLNLVLFGLLNKFITLRLKHRFVSYSKINLLAVVLFIVGIGINYKGIYQYIATGKVHIPWIRPLIGSILFLTGLHLITFSFLSKILSKK